MKTSLVCRFEVEGFHRWADAPEPHQWLQTRHRHIFKFEVRYQVEGDRVFEFIAKAAELKRVVERMFGRDPCEFGSRSCEAIGAMLMEYEHGMESVAVFEDGENGAVVSR